MDTFIDKNAMDSALFRRDWLEFHAIGYVGEGQRGELIDDLMRTDVEGLTLESLHL